MLFNKIIHRSIENNVLIIPSPKSSLLKNTIKEVYNRREKVVPVSIMRSFMQKYLLNFF
jgi:hypothetical protein